MIRNDSTALKNDPYKKVLLWMVKCSLEKSGLPAIAAISGVMMSATSAVTMAVNAVPTTIAIARLMRLPRLMKALKHFIDATPCGWTAGRRPLPGRAGCSECAGYDPDGTFPPGMRTCTLSKIQTVRWGRERVSLDLCDARR